MPKLNNLPQDFIEENNDIFGILECFEGEGINMLENNTFEFDTSDDKIAQYFNLVMARYMTYKLKK